MHGPGAARAVTETIGRAATWTSWQVRAKMARTIGVHPEVAEIRTMMVEIEGERP